MWSTSRLLIICMWNRLWLPCERIWSCPWRPVTSEMTLKPYETLVDPNLVQETLMANAAMRHLVSGQPMPQLSRELATFGQFVGSWDLTLMSTAPDGNRTELIAEWHFGWALHGRAVQDVLLTRTPDGDLVGYGTTVRTYDDRDGKWWIVWQDPIAHEFAVLTARPVEDRIELEGQFPQAPDRKFRWVFSDIKPSSFHWEALLSGDAGATWQVVEIIEASRRSAARSAPASPSRA